MDLLFADASVSIKHNHLAILCPCLISAMSAALQGASDRDFEDNARWLANTIKWYLSPKSAVRFLIRVVEIIEGQPDYEESQDMCGGFCAYPTCNLVCARASDSHRHCRCFQHQVENMRKRRILTEWNP